LAIDNCRYDVLSLCCCNVLDEDSYKSIAAICMANCTYTLDHIFRLVEFKEQAGDLWDGSQKVWIFTGFNGLTFALE